MASGPMSSRVHCLVIGAGVIGLAVARRLAMAGNEVVVTESETAIGTQTSSRNSEIIHAGIYYPGGSLKAKYCVAGKRALYHFCTTHGVEHRRCGKLIVATSEDQLPGLESLRKQAAINGVTDLEWCSSGEVAEMEPAVSCIAGLWSPSTGIIDSHGLMLALQADAEAAGAHFALCSPVLGGRIEDSAISITVGAERSLDVRANWVVNAAGLGAHEVAANLLGFESRFLPAVHYAKGNYFSHTGRPTASGGRPGHSCYGRPWRRRSLRSRRRVDRSDRLLG